MAPSKPLNVLYLCLVLLAGAIASDDAVLQALYSNFGGPSWVDQTGWSASVGCSTNPAGVTCDASGNVVGINLSNNNLIGNISDFALQLNSLSQFNLSGQLGVTFSQDLPSLQSLDLSRTAISGSIPSTFFPTLTTLRLSSTLLTSVLAQSLSVSSCDLSNNLFDCPTNLLPSWTVACRANCAAPYILNSTSTNTNGDIAMLTGYNLVPADTNNIYVLLNGVSCTLSGFTTTSVLQTVSFISIPGVGRVSVTTNGAVGQFVYNAPSVSTTSSLDTDGPSQVTITGNNFGTDPKQISLQFGPNAIPCQNIQFVTPHKSLVCTITLPGTKSGFYAMTVGGISSTVSSIAYTYLTPRVLSLSPIYPFGGNLTLVVTETGSSASQVTVTVAAQNCPVSSVILQSVQPATYSVTCTMPPGTGQNLSLVVTVSKLKADGIDNLSYNLTTVLQLTVGPADLYNAIAMGSQSFFTSVTLVLTTGNFTGHIQIGNDNQVWTINAQPGSTARFVGAKLSTTNQTSISFNGLIFSNTLVLCNSTGFNGAISLTNSSLTRGSILAVNGLAGNIFYAGGSNFYNGSQVLVSGGVDVQVLSGNFTGSSLNSSSSGAVELYYSSFYNSSVMYVSTASAVDVNNSNLTDSALITRATGPTSSTGLNVSGVSNVDIQMTDAFTSSGLSFYNGNYSVLAQSIVEAGAQISGSSALIYNATTVVVKDMKSSGNLLTINLIAVNSVTASDWSLVSPANIVATGFGSGTAKFNNISIGVGTTGNSLTINNFNQGTLSNSIWTSNNVLVSFTNTLSVDVQSVQWLGNRSPYSLKVKISSPLSRFALGDTNQVSNAVNVSIVNCVVTSTTYTSFTGRVVDISSVNALSIKGSTFNLNGQTAVLVSGYDMDTITLEDCTFGSNSGRGLGITTLTLGLLSINRSNFTGNSIIGTTGGGGLYVAATVNVVTLTSSTFASNYAKQSGGGISLMGGTDVVYVGGVTFSGNRGQNGGGLNFGGTNGQINITSCTFTSNSATQAGGGLSFEAISTADSLYFSNSTFVQNNAVTGGAIVTAASMNQLSIDNSHFTANSAKGKGGVLSAFLYELYHFSITNSRFERNNGYAGGSIYVDGFMSGDLVVQNTIFSSNRAASSAGGAGFVCSIGNGTFFINVTATNNIAGLQGGGLLLGGTSSTGATILDNLILNGNSGQYGGGMAITANNPTFVLNSCQVYNNTATQGGGLYFGQQSPPDVQMNQLLLKNNNATGKGGGVYIGSSINSLYLTGTLGTNNGAGVSGGAVYLDQPIANITLIDNTWLSNSAGSFGGAIHLSPNPSDTNSSALFRGETFSKNSAALLGGAVNTPQLQQSTNISSCSFYNNTAGQGGAIYMSTSQSADDVAVDISSSTFSGNVGGQGGAMSILGAYVVQLTLTGVTVDNNHASSGAGLACTGNFSRLIVRDSLMTNNVANVSGGAIDLQGAVTTVTIWGSTFTGNVGSQAGAIGVEETAQVRNLSLNSGVYANNAATAADGGFINVLGLVETLSFSRSQFTNNRALYNGGIMNFKMLSGSQNVTFDTCTASSNGAREGGAIFIDGLYDIGPRIVTDNGSKWTSNTAANGGGAWSVAAQLQNLQWNGVTFDGNTASLGGAISLSSATPTVLESCTLKNNKAIQQGGSIYGTTIDGLNINNTMIQGSAAAQEGGGVFIMVTNTLRLSNSTNTTKRDTGSNSDTPVLIHHSVFDSCSGGVGGGLYLVNPHQSTPQPAIVYGTSFSYDSANTGGGLAIGGDVTIDQLSFLNTKASEGSALAVVLPGQILVGNLGSNSVGIWLNNGTSIQMTGDNNYDFTGGCATSLQSSNGVYTCPAPASIVEVIKGVATNNSSNKTLPAIIGGVIGVVVLAVAVIIVVVIRRRHKRKHTIFPLANFDLKNFSIDAHKNVIIDFDELHDPVQIGRGAFGIVFRASWRAVPVAVKQLLNMDNITSKQMEEFLRELSILQRLRPHPNVVLFLGISVPPQPLTLVTEYCEGGSLYGYLKKHEDIPIAVKFKFIIGIAHGMFHLSSERIVHRDLAARNVLLSANLDAKVTDFGMSRETEDVNTGGTTTTEVGPLKWMSPEAITERRFSEKSDVYSYAVTIWEILSQKEVYPTMSPVNAAIATSAGNLRPKIEPDMPGPLVELMQNCWEQLPGERPSFRQICNRLRSCRPQSFTDDLPEVPPSPKGEREEESPYAPVNVTNKLLDENPRCSNSVLEEVIMDSMLKDFSSGDESAVDEPIYGAVGYGSLTEVAAAQKRKKR
ncbi:hypothetical protein PROFUN_11026 [Planoprotostelium fungivorum]|uniref:receptor protein-tyrosine kinase n=1 Tax=Planoprotostelium fungivorum TaxID=1890364 RepID=A0A2P6NBS7_9EUKA|nr:hypothetical protein PROFUN_11026 [Planoprotostelium fungivorum]